MATANKTKTKSRRRASDIFLDGMVPFCPKCKKKLMIEEGWRSGICVTHGCEDFNKSVVWAMTADQISQSVKLHIFTGGYNVSR